MASTNDLPPDDAALLAVVYLMTAVAEPPQAPLPQPLPPKRLARVAERVLERMSTLFLEAFGQDPSRSSVQVCFHFFKRFNFQDTKAMTGPQSA